VATGLTVALEYGRTERYRIAILINNFRSATHNWWVGRAQRLENALCRTERYRNSILINNFRLAARTKFISDG
jgi:hypothetical protein